MYEHEMTTEQVNADKAEHQRAREKRAFIALLARYFAENQSIKSAMLETGSPAAKDWAKLRAATPLYGYPTVEEAERILADFLS